MVDQVRSMESRVGRKNQRYGSKGERLVAGVVPLSKDKSLVLMIQSAGRGGWVLPKGGWETDEGSAQQAACREAWEEAGVVCTVLRDLGTIPDMRPSTLLSSNAPRASYQFFEVTVDREEDRWPEMHKRRRQWVPYAQAAAALASRPELLEALNRSSMKR
ncbi:NUDIX hydrolase domain-like protein [Aspergillus insuetus]|jgi:diphosphoinositol-polyphosphate diphosphatase|uniref:NUDIX hydrolase domain-like protein n=3 Tax=Aspergillus subgen. Nidulantes TaxID=2720870 RepID=A0ABR4G7T2_9EURO|nr:NUDIX hydrolase domain-like protein [Aspergillus carlsbadensis]CEL00611.1 Putative Nudix/MutT family protein (AFU_orthologue; AFUA_2G13080) [Aspergillus calidoustus]